MVITRSIGTLATQSDESPSIHLTDEAFVPCLGEVDGTDFFHKVFLVVDLPGAAVGHPGDGVGEGGVGEDVVEFHGEDGFGAGAVVLGVGRWWRGEVGGGMSRWWIGLGGLLNGDGRLLFGVGGRSSGFARGRRWGESIVSGSPIMFYIGSIVIVGFNGLVVRQLVAEG